jgi:hypothetical protein
MQLTPAVYCVLSIINNALGIVMNNAAEKYITPSDSGVYLRN